MAAYRTIAASDVRAFLERRGSARTGPHRMTEQILNWIYCARCGLLALKNNTTRLALRRPCVWEDD